MAVNFPDSPSNGDTFTSGALTFTWNGEAWKLDPSSGTKGEKGQKGEKGEVGEKGQKGQKGEIGDKGQKGEIGATGGTGGTGLKGQKGEVGAAGAAASKGQKGEVGATGSGGSTGQKGEPGAGGSGGQKGQKGEIGATGSGGSTGSKGQKGDDNSTKGQKGEVGSITAAIPSGGIIIWSGASNAVPSGWYLCNGSNGTPDLRDRFVVGAGSGYGVGNTGGQADAVIVSHNHSINDPTHGHSVNDPGHQHDTSVTNSALFPAFGNITIGYGGPGGYPATVFTMSNATTGIAVNANGTGITINNNGVSGTNKNLPPYYALCYIMKS